MPTALTAARTARKAKIRHRLGELIALRERINVEIQAAIAELETLGGYTRLGKRRSSRIRPACGTDAGYYWHRWQAKKGAPGAEWPLPVDDPCGCRAAHNTHRREADSHRAAQQAIAS